MEEFHSEKPVRILHITEVLSAAGIESFIMNLYRRIDRSAVQFDFLVMRDTHEFYDDEVASLGGKKYCIVSSKGNSLMRVLDESFQTEAFLKKHHYDIVHIHYTTPLWAPFLRALKRTGVPTRIYHSHSAYVPGKSWAKRMVYSFMRRKITEWGTDFFACSEAAASWIYEEELIRKKCVSVIYNGIDTEKFSFHESYRRQIREKYNLGDSFTVIHTGRFTEQKNQLFVIEIFEQLLKKVPDAVLMLLGDGELKSRAQQLAEQKGLKERILFLGVRSDVERYLSAADCYVMPSLYEGLPVAAVEAQCAGLPCVFSENITKETALTKECTFLKLEESSSSWAAAVMEHKETERRDCSEMVRKKGYEVQDIADNMTRFYLSRKDTGRK